MSIVSCMFFFGGGRCLVEYSRFYPNYWNKSPTLFSALQFYQVFSRWKRNPENDILDIASQTDSVWQ